jgi:lysophospholipase L1-like esterase
MPEGSRKALARLGLAVLGVLVGVATLALLELALRLTGIGAGAPRYDPFAGFSRTVPMFEPGERPDGTRIFRTAAARNVLVPQEFLAEKPLGGFRAFVVGESSAAGVPYSPSYAFSAFLEKRLRAELPSRPIEVVNAAISGYASRRILAVVEDIAHYQPDLLIIYAGHNEFGEARYYQHLVGMDPRLFRLWEWLAQTRLYAVMSQLPGVGVEAQKKAPRFDFNELDNSRQMFAVAKKHLDGDYPSERELAWGEEHYRLNLEKMIDAMNAVGAKVMLVTLGQDFADWAPGASSHRTGLSAAETTAFDAAVAQGDQSAASDCRAALEAYRRALAIDDTYADLHFAIARCQRQLGDFATARSEYRRASDLDRVPHGAPTRFNDLLRELARERGTMLADADPMLERVSPNGMVGSNLFADLVHPNLLANEHIAALVADVMRASGVPVPADQWHTGYTDPDPAALYAADPSLRIQEHLVRATACLLAQRDDCAGSAIAAALAIDPQNAHALQLAAGLAERTKRRDPR